MNRVDGDGRTDYAEFIAGTNPTDPTSKLYFLLPIIQSNGVVKLQWPAVPGRLYQIETSTNLSLWLPTNDWVSPPTSLKALAVTF